MENITLNTNPKFIKKNTWCNKNPKVVKKEIHGAKE